MWNTLKVGVLLVVMMGLFIAVGAMVGGKSGVLIAFGLAVLMNVGSFWFSDKIVLKMTGAQPVGPNEAPELYRMTEDLVRLANMPMPALYIINDPQPNAFATGRSPKHAAVAVNTGLLSILDKREVAGVVAHELAHIKHRDTLTMTIVATLAGALMTLVQIAQFSAIFGMGGNNDEDGVNPIVLIAMMIVGPIAATLVQMAVSRAREFEADRLAAQLTGSPDGLINALLKLERGAQAIPTHSMSPQNAHMCIVNPLRGMGGVTALFSTHPPIEKRVAALEALRSSIRPQSASPWS
jgi:heat shock protein HtpX